MDNLTQRLEQMLSDPGSLNQIMEMAASMGFPLEKPPEPERVSQVLQQAKTIDRKQEALVEALLPYLRPSRKARLQRAVQIAQLTHLAGFALSNSGKEQTNV